jgi:hypothetical protein
MKTLRFLLFTTAMLCAGARLAAAADPRYPDWPCVQAKVPELSIAAVWDGPSIEQAQKVWQDDPAIGNFVGRLAARRIPIEEAQRNVEDFLAATGAAKAETGVLLFAGLFETLNHQRTEVMNGLERLQRRQKGLADHIKSEVASLRELLDKSEQDHAKIDELNSGIEWSTRIYDDRRKSVSYACQVPVIIERRLFALGRTIRQGME